MPNANIIGLKELSELLEANNNTAGLSRLNSTVAAELQGPATLGEPGWDSDVNVIEEVVNAFLAKFARSAMHTSCKHPSADSVPDAIFRDSPTGSGLTRRFHSLVDFG